MPLLRYFKHFLLALTLLHLVSWSVTTYTHIAGGDGLLMANGTPVAGDFINMHAAGQLVLSGDVATIYDPQKFMAYERTIIPQEIGLRLWAYPPHSLLAVWPFGLTGFHAGLAVWSLLGLVVLGIGARRLGFDAMETAIIVLSPAALQCVYFGQTGNFFTGLLLIALASRKSFDGVGAVATAVLTMKPQTGFLLALLWLIEGRWRMIAITTVLTLALAGLALVLFGMDPWRDYVGLSLPLLSELEKYGSGAFMLMMPSVFMSLRLLGLGGDPALYIHLGFAVVVLVVLALALRQAKEPLDKAALLLLGTTLATPYLHSYDLAMLLCGALLVARRADALGSLGAIALLFFVVGGWALPNLIFAINALGAPVSPLIVLVLFGVAVLQSRR